MKTEKVFKIEFENEEVEVLKNICEFTNFFLAAACVTGGTGQPYGDDYTRTLKTMIDNFGKSKSFVNKINSIRL